jgi:O-antigen ligase
MKDKLDAGRFDIYKEAFERFNQYPIFGIGLYHDKTVTSLANFGSDIWQWHSTPLYVLTSFGIVGVLGFIPFYYQRYRLLLKNISVFKLACLIAVLSFEIYGLIDTMFINMYLNLFVFLWLALCEKEKCEEILPIDISFRSKAKKNAN